ncbi:hypothetical protein LQV05_003797 [Cryptococcus neoformans]|nr:hypothetical protein J007_03075 [Cryptococcus neoformans var. grubii]OXC61394.1 hypothetical protein C358_03159 [Cryptococcus neoformans var. grubii MW-RSA852]UOH81134.1 hypothetical protein LQV05_003797 [Cryptococcus neoformans]
MTSSPDYLGYAYASLLAIGGVMGGIRKGSVVSAVAGVGSGIAATYGANRVSKDRYDVIPSLTVSAVLLTLMSWRLYKTRKFMPAGLVVTLSLLMTVRYALP